MNQHPDQAREAGLWSRQQPSLGWQGRAGLGRARLGRTEREKRIFCLQAHKCLYWARPLVSLGGDQESLQICQSGLNCFPLPGKGLQPSR